MPIFKLDLHATNTCLCARTSTEHTNPAPPKFAASPARDDQRLMPGRRTERLIDQKNELPANYQWFEVVSMFRLQCLSKKTTLLWLSLFWDSRRRSLQRLLFIDKPNTEMCPPALQPVQGQFGADTVSRCCSSGFVVGSGTFCCEKY
ncbi:unnamed protein product [Ceratitis capitata]|uniref:(Mediterranean fruit fly) hypothetical protein n=1 Tax=Ceratitis capitata TaxID=7213 RepID=A0A811UVF6_CERCA|nr:unnamed protein product [Ceratitis capitata]